MRDAVELLLRMEGVSFAVHEHVLVATVAEMLDRDDVRMLIDTRVLELERCFCCSGRDDATLGRAPVGLVTAERAEMVDPAVEPS